MVNYDNFSETFSNSRKNLKWIELNYFLEEYQDFIKNKILDIGCGNGRFLKHLFGNNFSNINYLGIDSSAGMIKEAKKDFPKTDFLQLDMLKLHKLKEKDFNCVFFIASFHHLSNIEKRVKVLEELKKIIQENSYIFFTNWALESNLNKEKYEKNKLQNSLNEFGSSDYKIKIGKFNRFYHSFSLKELEYLFNKTGYKIIENRFFNNNRNIISVIHFKK